MSIPDEAVEAVFALDRERNADMVPYRDEETWKEIRQIVRDDLEAAAPFIRAQSLRVFAHAVEEDIFATRSDIIRSLRDAADAQDS